MVLKMADCHRWQKYYSVYIDTALDTTFFLVHSINYAFRVIVGTHAVTL